MKKYIFCVILTAGVVCSAFMFRAADAEFQVRIVASGLSDPWSVVCAPSGELWLTESKGYRVVKLDPRSGAKKTVLDLNTERKFPSFDQLKKQEQATPQGGLMGLALHPDFEKGKPYVYLSYVYKHLQEHQFLLRLARYHYDSKKQVLDSGVILCDTVPASNDHNGGRMLIASVSGKPFLFYGVGDQGSGQFSNGGRTNRAQQGNSYEGKILRFSLEPATGGSWIPSDNPFTKSAIWSVGHRNPQGLAFTIFNGKERLYSAEHGPYSDDEVNLIEKGKNYGHPLVIGYVDGNYNGLAASVSKEERYPGKWHTSYPFIANEKHNADSIGANFRGPAMSFYPTSSADLISLFKKVQLDEKAEWPAYAPSGIAVYRSKTIPGWYQSLLVTSLKTGKLLRLKLNDDGSVNPKIFEYVSSRARYRDVTVSADGTKIYLATDSSAITSGPTAENPKVTSQRGCILELTYIKNGTAKLP
ncbi:MAG: PQQ-dependent sugar dehydrogenase [Pedobacter sp.]